MLQVLAKSIRKKLFSLKLVSLGSKKKTVKRFLANALRCHETLLLYSINYLLSCYISIPVSMLKNTDLFCEKRTKNLRTVLIPQCFCFLIICKCSPSSHMKQIFISRINLWFHTSVERHWEGLGQYVRQDRKSNHHSTMKDFPTNRID